MDRARQKQVAIAAAIICFAAGVGGSRISPAFAELVYGLRGDNRLVTFDSYSPGYAFDQRTVTGLDADEALTAIDVRPATGELYAVSNKNRLYRVALGSGTAAASQVGADGDFALGDEAHGFDFNPVTDRLRITGGGAGQNLRLNPDTGSATIDGDLAYAGGDPNFGASPNICAAAYTPGSVSTTLYALDCDLDTLVTQNPPNDGTLNTVAPIGVSLPGDVGFDISDLTGDGLIATPDQLYEVDPGTGGTTPLGQIGDGGLGIIDIATGAVPEPAAMSLFGLGLIGLGYAARRRAAR